MDKLQAGTVIAGKYRLLEPISEGGMGAVWRAHHTQLEAPVAIKLVLEKILDKEGTVARFEREAKASARIRSPYVVHINDHGVDEAKGMPFIVMELLEGEDLQRRLRRVGRLRPEQALAICDKVCKGLARAHEIGIVHRDLKPANIFLCEPDDETVKILDFGIAKEIGERKIVGDTTTPGQVLGTPHYMSPEQARGQKLTPASDVWALSVIMYRTLVGQRPFDAHEYGDLVVKICSESVVRPSELNPELPPSIDAFFERAFDRTSGGRFETVAAFSAAFTEAVESAALDPTVRRSPASQKAGDGAMTDRADAAVRRIIRRVPPKTEPEKRSMRPVILGVGVILAGAIILVVARRPGEFNLGAIAPAFEEAARELDEAINGKPIPSGVLPSDATPEQKAAAKERAREDAWRTLYQQVKSGEIPLAVATLEEILGDQGWRESRRPTVVALAAKALGRPDQVHDRMVALVREAMGEHGPDVLFDVMVSHAETPAAKVARKMLEGGMLKKGSADLQLAYRVHAAPPCAKKGVIVAGKAVAGPTTLRQIEAAMTCTSVDPCCSSGDPVLAAVAEAIRERAVAKGGGHAGD